MNLKTMIVAVTIPAASGGIASAQRELSAFQDTRVILTCRSSPAAGWQTPIRRTRTCRASGTVLAHKHAINVPRLQQNIHDVIVCCKADQDITIIMRST